MWLRAMPKLRKERSPQDRLSHEKLNARVQTALGTLEGDKMTASMTVALKHRGSPIATPVLDNIVKSARNADWVLG